jgi:hypothetical protein
MSRYKIYYSQGGSERNSVRNASYSENGDIKAHYRKKPECATSKIHEKEPRGLGTSYLECSNCGTRIGLYSN